MAEYIEREEAFNAVLKLVPKVDDDGYCWVIRGDAATAIDNITAADVQPVVLCRECRSYNRPRLGFCETHLVRMHGDDFCSYGKKREES